MNSHQRRKIFRKTGKHIKMNTTVCNMGHKARPTKIGYYCPKCQEWGKISQKQYDNLNLNSNEHRTSNKKS